MLIYIFWLIYIMIIVIAAIMTRLTVGSVFIYAITYMHMVSLANLIVLYWCFWGMNHVPDCLQALTLAASMLYVQYIHD